MHCSFLPWKTTAAPAYTEKKQHIIEGAYWSHSHQVSKTSPSFIMVVSSKDSKRKRKESSPQPPPPIPQQQQSSTAAIESSPEMPKRYGFFLIAVFVDGVVCINMSVCLWCECSVYYILQFHLIYSSIFFIFLDIFAALLLFFRPLAHLMLCVYFNCFVQLRWLSPQLQWRRTRMV